MPVLRSVRRTFSAMKWWEKIALSVFTFLFAVSSIILLHQFYLENTEIVPVRGGTYIEGSVGTIRMLNPWFTITNDVNRDITSLVFSGLQRYNPFTGKIEDDMATLTISGNNRVYTLTLRDNLFFHDSTEENPHPVTAEDVAFTFRTIQQQGFPNPILQKNFRGVDIEMLDDRTVQFRLEKPYFFFRSNMTLGILPKRSFESIPTDRLLEALDFHLHPIGSGPYRFKGMIETELSTEVTLESNPSYYGARPFIDRVVFQAFPDYPSLLSDLRNLDGVRHVPRNPQGRPIIPNRYRTFLYTLPQYVALFYNLDREMFGDQKLRLGLQLATNKEEIIETINEEVIIDTPLLENTGEDWQYQFQPEAAEGAFYDSAWHLPEKVRLQHLLENRERNATGALALPQPVVLLQTGASLVFTGSFLPDSRTITIYQLPVFPNPEDASGSWIMRLPTDGSTGSILIGENFLRLRDSNGTTIDTYVITRAADQRSFQRLREEQKIVDLFLERHEDGITVNSLRLEEGFLRLKSKNDPYGVRVNDRGSPLSLRLLTSNSPPTYPAVAETVAEQWRKVGVGVETIIPNSRQEFEQRVIRRDYDVLLFGQPLLDNLDSYPFWHSSQTQVRSENLEELQLDANNLSQYANFRTDALLEEIRETHDTEKRKRALELLREVFREDVPAIVLYTPTYVFAVSKEILGVEIGTPSLHSDRFLGMHRWFIKQKRTFRAGKSWITFLPWLLSLAQ